ncbi:MAG: hypothetical protein ABIH20_03960 [Candidatus Diapherotrites archaeon]
MNKKIMYLTLIISFLILLPAVTGADLFYLRGDSKTEEVDFVEYYEISITAPKATTQTTTISKTTVAGVHELESWFTELVTSEFSISNSAYLYFSSIGISGDTGKYRWTVYDYNPVTTSSIIIVQSNWYTIPTTPSPHETFANVPSYTFAVGRRAKLVLEYNADSGGGTITAILDEGSSGNSVQYNSSGGSSYNITDVSNAVLILVNSTGSCSIACTSNTACNDSDSLTTDTCSNAGGCNSVCVNLSSDVEIACSSNSDCDDSNSLTTDSCLNPGTGSSSCSSAACSIVCSLDSDCPSDTNGTCSNAGTCSAVCSYGNSVDVDDPTDDNNDSTEEIICTSDYVCNDRISITTDTCVNPGTISSYCENIQCSIACSSNSACNDADTLTTDFCANAGLCDSGCIYNSCNPVCSNSSDCDDGNPETTDVCAGAGRCTATCENLPDVGDGVCGSGETKCSAPADCGVCGGSISEVYELACIGNSCKTTIKLGVCGNNRCESGENYFNCPVDCVPQNIEIDASFPDTFYVRGETVQLKATILVDGEKVSDADVKASGFFGTVPLLNDGKHDEGTRNDNIYANFITIDFAAEKNLYPVTFIVEVGGVKSEKIVFFNLVPKLSFLVDFEKEFFILGDNIKIDGRLTLKKKHLNLPLNLNVSFNSEIILNQDLNSANGNFSSNYRTTLINEPGDYIVTIKAADENGNVGFFEKTITVLSPEATNFLIIEIVDTNNNSFKKGSEAEIVVNIYDIERNPVSKAIVKGETKDGLKFSFEENDSLEYAGSFKLPYQTRNGELSIKVVAQKQNKQGSAETSVNVTEVKINLEIIEPKKDNFLVGEEIKVKIYAAYEDGTPLLTESVSSIIGNETIELKGTGKGVYEGVYLVKTTDEGTVSVTINLQDGFDNTAVETMSVDISGISYLYYLRIYGTSIGLFLIASIITIIFGYGLLKKRFGINALQNKEKQVLETIKGIQTQYFIEGTMDKQTYDVQMEKYETKLQDIRETIKQMVSKVKK